jgi:hypothetical protein
LFFLPLLGFLVGLDATALSVKPFSNRFVPSMVAQSILRFFEAVLGVAAFESACWADLLGVLDLRGGIATLCARAMRLNLKVNSDSPVQLRDR